MRCDDCRQALSAQSDGELSEVERRAVTTHLAGCAHCRAFAVSVESVNRQLRVRPADQVPDLSARIVAAAARSTVAKRHTEWPRYVLLWVGLTQLALAAPALFGSAAGTSIHAAREVGSFDLALGVGMLVAAWQPRRAAGLLPLAFALVAALALSAGLDLVAGRVSIAGESQHVLDVIGLVTLWLLARSAPAAARRGRLLPA